MTELSEIAKASHANARAKGFHDLSDRLKAHTEEMRVGCTPCQLEADPELADYIDAMYAGNRIALIIGELIEAHEELRSGKKMGEAYTDPAKSVDRRVGSNGHTDKWETTPKPEGIPSELADVVIRVLDTAVEFGIDLEEVIADKARYNRAREAMHGRAF